MTVKELVEELQRWPSTLLVVVPDGNGDGEYEEGVAVGGAKMIRIGMGRYYYPGPDAPGDHLVPCLIIE